MGRYLRHLKGQTNRSYGALAFRVGVSSSTLHRYCSGSAVPPDFAVVERFGRVCGATRDDLRELRRRWLAATAPTSTAHAHAQAGAQRAAAAVDVPAAMDRPVYAEHRPEEPREGSSTKPVPATRATRAAKTTRLRARRVRTGILAAVATVVAALAAYPLLTIGGFRYSTMLGGDQRLLLSPACPAVLGLSERGECAREVQRLLRQAGLRTDVAGELDTPTRQQVTAFQVLAGIPVDSVVDAPTKRALYTGTVRVKPLPQAQIEQMIRAAFPEDADRAIEIARCQSGLDPVSVASREDNGTRLWGLFRIPDDQVTRLGGTPKLALDAAWNIQAARRLWGPAPSGGSSEGCG